MKTILCFGDSNTWGYQPGTGTRYGSNQRWTGVLRHELGAGYHVIEEGLNGRTTVWDDPLGGYKNGKDYLIPCLETHRPIELIILLLGTNDVKKRFAAAAYDIARGMEVLVNIVEASQSGPGGRCPKILIMTPPPLGRLTELAASFEGAAEKVSLLAGYYRRIADDHACEFFDTSTVVVSSDIDGIHWEPEEHRKLGRAIAETVRRKIC